MFLLPVRHTSHQDAVNHRQTNSYKQSVPEQRFARGLGHRASQQHPPHGRRLTALASLSRSRKSGEPLQPKTSLPPRSSPPPVISVVSFSVSLSVGLCVYLCLCHCLCLFRYLFLPLSLPLSVCLSLSSLPLALSVGVKSRHSNVGGVRGVCLCLCLCLSLSLSLSPSLSFSLSLSLSLCLSVSPLAY